VTRLRQGSECFQRRPLGVALVCLDLCCPTVIDELSSKNGLVAKHGPLRERVVIPPRVENALFTLGPRTAKARVLNRWLMRKLPLWRMWTPTPHSPWSWELASQVSRLLRSSQKGPYSTVGPPQLVQPPGSGATGFPHFLQ